MDKCSMDNIHQMLGYLVGSLNPSVEGFQSIEFMHASMHYTLYYVCNADNKAS